MSVVPPTFLLIVGAAVIAVVPRAWRATLCVLLPLATLAYVVAAVPAGTTVTHPFLAYTLELVRADPLGRLFAGIFCLIAAIAGLYAWHESDAVQQVAAVLYAAGAVGVALAGDLLTLFAFWELMAVAATVLVWARRTAGSARAGTRYVLVHIAGGAVLLLGILLHVASTGSILFRGIDSGAASVGAWLILAGFCLNAAVPPLGAWLPDAYPRATVTGAVFLSALTTKAAVYALLRGFAGWDVLVPAGVAMALYGVVYAVLANDIRELLSYHIISQVGYMVAGAGIGTELAINGAAAHAVCHILYKALLFMGAGAVIQTTGRATLTSLGGFAARQRVVFALYMIGAFSISGFPLWNGFVSKPMIVKAAGDAHLDWAVLLLVLASIGTFLHTGLKLPYFTWMGPDRGIKPTPAPVNMVAAMAVAAVLCTLIGVAPGLLYRFLPYATDYQPYNAAHLVEVAQLLVFTFFSFYVFIPSLGGERTLSVDTDVVYRKLAPVARAVFVVSVDRAFGAVQALAGRAARGAAAGLRDPTALGAGQIAAPRDFDADRARPPLLTPLLVTLVTFVAVAIALLSAAGSGGR